MEDVSAGAVPERTPACDRLNHDGKPVACHVKGVVPPLKANVWLYAMPDVVAGNVVVVTDGVGLMVSANVLRSGNRETVGNAQRKSSPYRPRSGVPLSTPPVVMVSHAGRVVPLSANVSVPVPPAAAMVCAYERLIVQVGRGDDVVIVNCGFTVTLNCLLPVARTLSVAVTLKL